MYEADGAVQDYEQKIPSGGNSSLGFPSHLTLSNSASSALIYGCMLAPFGKSSPVCEEIHKCVTKINLFFLAAGRSAVMCDGGQK